MYQIKSNNNFYLNSCYELLNQKNFPISLTSQNSNFGIIFLEFKLNVLTVEFNNTREKIDLPLNSHIFTKTIFELLQESEIIFDQLTYSPIKETLSNENTSLKLRNTHNLIIREALMNKGEGINKTDLYKIIWPKDINIQINKLDTHLTNLKNLLQEHFDYTIKFKSNQGKIIFLSY